MLSAQSAPGTTARTRAQFRCRHAASLILLAGAAITLAFSPPATQFKGAFDQAARLQLLEKPDGLLEHVKSPYNDIHIHKKRQEVTMSFQIRGWHYTESRTNLLDPSELSLMYSRAMTSALIYPVKLDRILMIGLGGGSISSYFSIYLPQARIDAVDIDAAVIDLARKYFGIRETETVRYHTADGREYLKNSKEQYDLILLDAYDGGSIPSQLMTREFYELVKSRLAPGGAVASNLHDGTKLFGSSIVTLQSVFGPLELYPSGRGEIIVVGVNGPMPDADAQKRQAQQLQEKHQFRYSPVFLLSQKRDRPLNYSGDILTDASVPGLWKKAQDEN